MPFPNEGIWPILRMIAPDDIEEIRGSGFPALTDDEFLFLNGLLLRIVETRGDRDDDTGTTLQSILDKIQEAGALALAYTEAKESPDPEAN